MNTRSGKNGRLKPTRRWNQFFASHQDIVNFETS